MLPRSFGDTKLGIICGRTEDGQAVPGGVQWLPKGSAPRADR